MGFDFGLSLEECLEVERRMYGREISRSCPKCGRRLLELDGRVWCGGVGVDGGRDCLWGTSLSLKIFKKQRRLWRALK